MSTQAKKYPVIFTLGAHDGASAKFANAVRKMRADAKGIQNVGKSMTMGVTAPILGMGVAATHFAVGFAEEMSNVSTIIDTSKEDLDAMGKGVLDISKRAPVKIQELTGALYDLRSSGVSAGDQFRVLEKSAQLAVVGLGTVKEAGDLVTSGLNAFQLKGKDADRIYNNIFAAAQYGKTTIAGLAQGFGGVAGTVASSTTKLDEYLSAVAALTTTGLPAAESHTQLKAVISGLTRETKDSRKVFRALGAKDLPDLIKQSGGLVPALGRIREELGGNSAKILKLVGSTEALNAVMSLTGAQAQVQKDALAAMRSEADMVGEAFTKKNMTTAAAIQRSRNSVEATAISVGEKLAPSVERMADNVAAAADSWGRLSPQMQNGIIVTGGLLAVAGPLTTVVGWGAGAYTWLAAGIVKYSLAAKAGIIWTKGLAAAKAAWLAVTTAVTGAISTLGTAMVAAFGPVAAPIIAIAAALGAVALVIKKVYDLNKDLAGSGGIFGTAAKMWEMGTLDVFKAHDAVQNEKAIEEAKKRKAAAATVPKLGEPTGVPTATRDAVAVQGFDAGKLQQMAESMATESKVVVDFRNMPAGVRTEGTTKGPGGLDINTGPANGGGL